MLLKWEIPYEIDYLSKGTLLTWNSRDFVSLWKAAVDQLLISNVEKGVFFMLRVWG